MPKAIPVYMEKVQDRVRNTNQIVPKADDRSGAARRAASNKEALLPKIPRGTLDQPTVPVAGSQAQFITPWMEAMTYRTYISAAERLHDEIVAFTTWISPTPTEDKATQSILACVTNSIAARFPEETTTLRVKAIGSVATGLSVPGSDLNIEICIERKEIPQRKIRIATLHAILIEDGLSVRQQACAHAVAAADGTNYTSLWFFTPPELCSRRVAFTRVKESDEVSSTKEVMTLLVRYPALKPLFLVLKTFLSARFLITDSGMSSYGLIKLCARFLESNPCDRPKEQLDDPLKERSLGLLLIDFLYYFSYYNYEGLADALAVRALFPVGLPRGNAAVRESTTDKIQFCFQQAWTYFSLKGPGDRDLLGPIVSVTAETVGLRADVIAMVYSDHLDKISTKISKLAALPEPPLIQGYRLGSVVKENHDVKPPSRRARRKRSWSIIKAAQAETARWLNLFGPGDRVNRPHKAKDTGTEDKENAFNSGVGGEIPRRSKAAAAAALVDEIHVQFEQLQLGV